jgi:hypothetical protein
LQKPHEHRLKIRPSVFGNSFRQPRRDIAVPRVRDRPNDKERDIGGNSGPGDTMAFGIDGTAAGLASKLLLSLDRVRRTIDSDDAFLEWWRDSTQPIQQAATPS